MELPISEKFTLTLKEASEYVSLSVDTLRRACKDGRLRYTMRCRRMLIQRTELEEWVSDGGGVS